MLDYESHANFCTYKLFAKSDQNLSLLLNHLESHKL